MAFTDFTLSDLAEKFGISNKVEKLFSNVTPVKPSDLLVAILKQNSDLPLKSEKAKSEGIIFPILLDIREKNKELITIYSGELLNADREKGLYGECDFIISKNIPIILRPLC